MYVQLVDKHNFRSPVLYIHADENEFLEQIEIWRQDLFKWIKDNPKVGGMPLGRLEPATCIIDLMRHLIKFYVETTEFSFVAPGRVIGSLRLQNQEDIMNDEDPIEIKLFQE